MWTYTYVFAWAHTFDFFFCDSLTTGGNLFTYQNLGIREKDRRINIRQKLQYLMYFYWLTILVQYVIVATVHWEK